MAVEHVGKCRITNHKTGHFAILEFLP